MIADRPRPARADHRRPRHRQDRRSRSTRSSTSSDTDVICIYVAIGQKASTVAQVVRAAAAKRARWSTRSSSPRRAHEAAPIKWMAPFAGAAMGEHFLYNGKHALVHLRRPLEARRRLPPAVAAAAPPAGPRGVSRATSSTSTRACSSARCKLNDELGGGSLTALPIIETQAGDVVGLHPDERDLDHRRADLPRVRPLLLGRPAGDQRRHLGLARRRQRRRRRR